SALLSLIAAQDGAIYKPGLKNFEYLLKEVGENLSARKEVSPGTIVGKKGDRVYSWKFDTLGDMASLFEADM
ncbi:hypothetical protein jhhlp_001734, partial [Lomentospora prolificans]